MNLTPLFTQLDLGRMRDIPMGITDATPLKEGGWLLSVVAENTSNAYDDSQCHGSALVACDRDRDGNVAWTQPLDGALKVEGIAFDACGALWLTTDADAPGVQSDLRRMAWPLPGFRLQSRQATTTRYRALVKRTLYRIKGDCGGPLPARSGRWRNEPDPFAGPGAGFG